MTMQRCLSLFLALCVVSSAVFLNGVMVSAAETDSGTWTELLEITSVQDNGENWFTLKGSSCTITLHMPNERRLAKIDMLVWHQTAERIQSVSVTQGNSKSDLNVLYVGNNITRVYGSIPNSFYQDLNITFSRTGSGTVNWELLSCKVNTLATQSFDCDYYYVIGSNLTTKYTGFHDFAGDGAVGLPSSTPLQLCVVVDDWAKYDSIILFGSIDRAGVGSIRASVGNLGLPYDITFTQTLPTGEITMYNYDFTWSDYSSLDGGYGDITGSDLSAVRYNIKTLFRIEIDLSGVDRTALKNQILTVYFTYVYNDSSGFSFNMQAATGFVSIADTSDMNWWTRFTTFMEGLFASDSSETNNMMESVTDQSQELVEDRLGAVAQASAVVDGLVGSFQNHGVTESIAFPSLTINFGSIPWTFGGWDVQIVPPGFEPVIETLKVIIDIVATLAFLHAMRSRLEKLLVGGNA